MDFDLSMQSYFLEKWLMLIFCYSWKDRQHNKILLLQGSTWQLDQIKDISLQLSHIQAFVIYSKVAQILIHLLYYKGIPKCSWSNSLYKIKPNGQTSGFFFGGGRHLGCVKNFSAPPSCIIKHCWWFKYIWQSYWFVIGPLIC